MTVAMQAFVFKAFALICAVSVIVSAKHLVEDHAHDHKHDNHDHKHDDHDHKHDSGKIAIKEHHDAGNHHDLVDHHDHHVDEHHNVDKYDYSDHYYTEQHGAAGYYWRNFKWEVPKDALPGGKNMDGHTTYIGQVLHEDQLLPAKIDPEAKKVYFEHGFKEYVAHKNVKILCTQHPEQFRWINTSSEAIHDLIEKHHLVEGGYEGGVTLFIGRKQLPDELAVGKVACTKDHTTLNITKEGVCVQHGDFEVLSYVEKKKTVLISRHGAISYDSAKKGKAININININNGKI